MSGGLHASYRVLSIYPFHRGFAFAILESEARLVDWGIARVDAEDDSGFLSRLNDLIERYRPTILAVEDGSNRRRGLVALRRVDRSVGLAQLLEIKIVLVSRVEVRHVLSAAIDATRHDIAALVADAFPELRPQLPRMKRLWEGENERMKIFDAVALALAWRGAHPK